MATYLRMRRGDFDLRLGGDRLGGENHRARYGERRIYDLRGGDLRRAGDRDMERDLEYLRRGDLERRGTGERRRGDLERERRAAGERERDLERDLDLKNVSKKERSHNKVGSRFKLLKN